MNPETNILRELFWGNPMTLEATRSLRRFFRAGMNGEGTVFTSALNKFMLCALVLLYAFTILGLVSTQEDLSQMILPFEAAILTLLIPGSLYGAIAIEREKQTYDALIMTRLTPAQIVFGKLWWRVGLIAAVMGLFAPLLAITHFAPKQSYYHLTVSQVLWSQVGMFTWSILLGALSLWVSAKSKKGITALLVTFGLIAMFLIGIPALTMLVESGTHANYPGEYNDFSTQPGLYACGYLMAANPFLQLFTLSSSQDTFHSEPWLKLWFDNDIRFWAVILYAACAAGFLHGAVKTLRGLEMPTIDRSKTAARRGKRGS